MHVDLDNENNIVDSQPKMQDEEIVSIPPKPTPPPKIDEQHPKQYVRTMGVKQYTELPIELQTVDTGARVTLPALLDCGATGLFMDTEFVQGNNLMTRKLPRAIPVYNVDGTLNEGGSITQELDMIMHYKDHTERATFAVCNLGRRAVIVGHTWLKFHNPEINWQTGEVSMTRCPVKCGARQNLSCQKQAKRWKSRVRKAQNLPAIAEDSDEAEEEERLNFEHEDSDRLFIAMLHPREEVNATSTASQRFAEEASKVKKEESLEDIVPKEYHDFEDVFSKTSFDELPAKKPWDHAIELKAGFEPRNCKLYPLSTNEQEQLDEFLEENLKSGRIRPSKSPMASPVFFVKKKDGSLRLVQDYRNLNAFTIKNRYPLPLISELIEKLRKARYFTKLDVRWGYNNVRMKEGDEWKAAFRTNRGMFEPLVMFFGLTNSPATFQTMMNDIFRVLINEGHVMVYMDDILIFTETLEEHRSITRRVLELMRLHKLYLKAAKCEFEKLKIEYLGLIISEGKIEMDPVKVEGVSRWPAPTTVKEVQSFLGFTNFYRRFIEGFADIAKPLHSLTRKDSPWKWDTEQQQAFDELKRRVTSSPILRFPNEDKAFRVEADSSDYATGAVLSQLADDDKWHPVAFLSKSLSEVERNYEIHDKEMLAIIRALEEWRHHLEGAKQRFEILTDHKNLEYFMTAKKLNRRQARWSLFLSRFDFELHHRPGKSSLKPDALSRRADHGKGENDNENLVLLKPEFFKIQAFKRGHVLISGDEKGFLAEIRNSKSYDESVVKAVEELKKSPERRVKSEEWCEEQGLILFRGKVYVPKNDALRRKIVHAHHDTPVGGHPGRWKTIELVSRNYWWPNLTRFIAQYVAGCDLCNRTKTYPAKPMGTLMPNRIPTKRWQVITTDLIVGLPNSQGYDSIFVAVDRLSKRFHAAPTTSEVNSEGIAKLFRDNVWRHHGLPEEVISDRGPQFVSAYMKELNRLLGIKTAASTAYHPQTDGQTERINQEIEQFLRLFVNHRQDDWIDWLPLAEFCYNNRVQASTRQTPFMLDTGQHPRLGTEPRRETKVEAVDDFLKRMKGIQEEARSALEKAAEDMTRFYDEHRREAPEYRPGDKVWLDARDLKTTRPSKKLDNKWLGPYEVQEQVSRNAYKLKLPKTLRIHPVFHVVKLRLCPPDTIPGRRAKPPPPPEIQDGQQEYEVERVDDSRFRRGHLEYLIKWKGYPVGDSTWEPEGNLQNAQKALHEFHQLHPSAPRKISIVTFADIPFRRYENFTEVSKTQRLFDWTEGKAHRDAVP